MVKTLERKSMQQITTPRRITLDDMDHLSIGKKTRLHRMLYEHGPKNGTLLFLPIDQGLEHGPIDFFENPASEDSDFQCRLAVDAGYSGIVFHFGLAEKYMKHYAGKIPLVLKINGKTTIPSDSQAFSSLTGTVEEAVRLGADAIGYTLYVGSPAQDRDIEQFMMVRQEADRFGIPVIMWAYPRGEAIEKKGGRDSLYAVDYAARVACELGADVVKINIPKTDESKRTDQPGEYKTLQLDYEDNIRKVIRSAGKTMVLFSGGSKVGDEDLLEKARIVMECGATGLIFGRNMWQRPMEQAMAISKQVKQMMQQL